MSKRPINTDLGMPKGAPLKTGAVKRTLQGTSASAIDKAIGFGITLRINTDRKFSFAYNVPSAQRRRANLLANRGKKTSSTEEN